MQSLARLGGFHVDDVEIAGSLSQGVYVNGPIGFDASSRNLRVHGSAGFPVHVYARVIGSVPTGTYTGNGRDAIAISGPGGAVSTPRRCMRAACRSTSAARPDGGRMDVDSQVAGQVAVLTIEPGVTIQFPPGGIFNVGPSTGTAPAQGALIAIGGPDPADEIVFTSDKRRGVGGRRLARHRLRRRDRYAQRDAERARRVRGRHLDSPAATRVPTRRQRHQRRRDPHLRPAGDAVHHRHRDPRRALHYGIDRGWRADLQPDFLAEQHLHRGRLCKQTVPRTSEGVCPLVVPCP